MRLAVVHDESGQILAAADLSAPGLIARPMPISTEHTALEVEVPYEHRQGDLYEMCQRLRVDPERKQLVLREAGD